MTDLIVLAVLGLILGLAGGYVWKAKKQGRKCIGCPDGGKCSGICGSCGGCCGEE